MDIKRIFTDGNLVDINVSMWTAKKLLTPEDLGLAQTDISSAFTLGNKSLIPANVIAELRSLENKARSILIEHSFTFTFGGARFIPKKRFIEFVDAIDKIIALFDAKADDLAKNYMDYRRDMRSEYVTAAHEAFNRATSLCVGFDITEDDFVNRFLERIEQSYPKAEEIRKKFHMEYSVFQVALPDISQASYEDILDENGKIKIMQDAYQKSLYNKVNSFVESSTNELRSKATEVLTRFSNGLGEGKRINEGSLNSIKKMIDTYEKMDFIGDKIFLDHLKMFQAKCIDCYPAKTILTDEVVKSTVIRELKAVLKAAQDKSAIEQLALKYRSSIHI